MSFAAYSSFHRLSRPEESTGLRALVGAGEDERLEARARREEPAVTENRDAALFNVGRRSSGIVSPQANRFEDEMNANGAQF